MAETLPTSSAIIEQSFSVIKLLKTDLRNKLSQHSPEGLVLVGEEYRQKKNIKISDRMMNLYDEVKQEVNMKKLDKQSLASSKPVEKNQPDKKSKKEEQHEGDILTDLSMQMENIAVSSNEPDQAVPEKPKNRGRKRQAKDDDEEEFSEEASAASAASKHITKQTKKSVAEDPKK